MCESICACFCPCCFVMYKRGCCGTDCCMSYFLGMFCCIPSICHACTFVGKDDDKGQTVVVQVIQPQAHPGMAYANMGQGQGQQQAYNMGQGQGQQQHGGVNYPHLPPMSQFDSPPADAPPSYMMQPQGGSGCMPQPKSGPQF